MSRKIHFPKSPHPHKNWAKSRSAFKKWANSSSRVERDAPCYRVRPLGLRLPSKRASPFFGGYPSSNRTCSFPAYGSPCGPGFISFAPLRPSAPFHIEEGSFALRLTSLSGRTPALGSRTRLRALRVAFGEVPSERPSPFCGASLHASPS